MFYSIIRLGDMLSEIGEETTKGILANFSCSLDADVEYFIREQAIEYHTNLKWPELILFTLHINKNRFWLAILLLRKQLSSFQKA